MHLMQFQHYFDAFNSFEGLLCIMWYRYYIVKARQIIGYEMKALQKSSKT